MAELVGRAEEIAALDALLRHARDGHGGALVIVGDAGIGKTALLDRAVDRAEHLGFAVHRTLGTVVEQSLPYAGLHALLAQDLRGPLDPRLATAVALGDMPTPALVPAVAAGLFDHYVRPAGPGADPAAQRPVFVVVDDLPWLDPSSAAVVLELAQLATQERNTRLAVLVTLRVEAPLPAPLLNASERLATLRLRHLSESESIGMLSQLGCDRLRASELAARAGGLPFLLAELARKLTAGTFDPASLVAQLPSVARERLDALDEHGWAVVRVAAIEPDLAVVRAIAGPAAEAGVGSAVRHAILQPPKEDGRLAFVNPSLHAAALGSLSQVEEGAIHRAVADALDRSLDADRVALHLASATSGPDAEVRRLLEAFAERATLRGALREASDAHCRAATFTTDNSERIVQVLRGAGALFRAGDSEGAISLAEHATDLAETALDRLRAEISLAQVSVWVRRPSALRQQLEGAAERAKALDASLSAWASFLAVTNGYLGGDIHRAIETARRGIVIADAAGDVVLAVALRVALAWHLFLAGKAAEAASLLDQFEPLVMRAIHADLHSGLDGAQLYAMVRVITEKWSAAEQTIETLLRVSDRTGSRPSHAFAAFVRGDLLWRQGRLIDADGVVAVQLSTDLPILWRTWGRTMQVRIAATLGREDEAEAQFKRALKDAVALDVPLLQAILHASVGHLHLSAGRDEEALASLDRVAALLDGMGLEEPNLIQWEGDHLEVLVRVGRVVEAREVVERLHERSRAVGGRGWADGVVARAEGQLAALVNLPTAAQHYDDALRHFLGVGMRTEVARTYLVRGGPGDAEEALRMFTDMGASLWAERSRHACRAATADTQRGTEMLTPAERRVAMVVASGRTNRQAAEELGIGAQTVDYHLRSVYRKLGLRNRSELVARFNRTR